MDANQAEGVAREIGGRVEDAAGGLTGDAKLQAEGKLHQAAGRLQSQYGAAAETVADAAGQIARGVQAQPLAALLVAGAIGYLLGTLRR